MQEAWLRISRAATSDVHNLGARLTTVVGRVCLNMLRSRATRREDPLGTHVPDPVISRQDGTNPEQQALLADSVALALLVVLKTLPPAERLAFVLHDMFAIPFDQIAPIIDRSPEAARQLASRARRRVQGATPAPDRDLTRQRQVVDAFFAAARGGDFEARARNSRDRTVAGGTASRSLTGCSPSPPRSRSTSTARCSGVSRSSTSRTSTASCGSPRAGILAEFRRDGPRGGAGVKADGSLARTPA